jgi:four helix bundle protein
MMVDADRMVAGAVGEETLPSGQVRSFVFVLKRRSGREERRMESEDRRRQRDEGRQNMTFEDLESWQQARKLTKQIYSVTRENGIDRDFGFCSQIQRAGVSAMSNLAEGFERRHIQEKLQFYNVAHASTAEVRSLSYVLEDNYPKLASEAVELRRNAIGAGQLVGGLIRSTQSRK